MGDDCTNAHGPYWVAGTGKYVPIAYGVIEVDDEKDSHRLITSSSCGYAILGALELQRQLEPEKQYEAVGILPIRIFREVDNV